MPEMKDLVPSIGSSTQTYSASVRSAPYSSPMMPWSGKFLRISARMAFSAARSAAVTGSKPPRLLVLDRQRGAEERQDGIAGGGGELIDEAAEVDGRHAASAASHFRGVGRDARQPDWCRRLQSAVRVASLFACNADTSAMRKCMGNRLSALIFVRRSVNYCNAVARLPLPSLGVSSLDLGRLHPRAALFLVWSDLRLFGRRAIGPQFLERNLAEPPRQASPDRPPGGRNAAERSIAPLVHVERAVDLELDGMQAGGRIAVMLGDEAAGIGLVAADL